MKQFGLTEAAYQSMKAPPVEERVVGQQYITLGGNIRVWNGHTFVMTNDDRNSYSRGYFVDKPSQRQQYMVNHRYGLTHDDYMQLMSEQNFKCGICSAPLEPFDRSCHVDHEPGTGKIQEKIGPRRYRERKGDVPCRVRGMLDASCNSVLASYEKSVRVGRGFMTNDAAEASVQMGDQRLRRIRTQSIDVSAYMTDVAERQRSFLQRKYELTPEEKIRLWLDQGKNCPICSEPIPDPWDRSSVVDHDHSEPKGFVRGLLHSDCNTTLGRYEKAKLENRPFFHHRGGRGVSSTSSREEGAEGGGMRGRGVGGGGGYTCRCVLVSIPCGDTTTRADG